MLFNSFVFIILFLPVTFGGYFLLQKIRPQLASIWLAFASLFFYAYWNIVYLPILLFSILFNYILSIYITPGFEKSLKEKARKCVFLFAIIFNLGLLGFFKYSNFFIENINILVGSHIQTLKILLPLGISFFTFQKIAYLVDCYKGKAHEKNFLRYLLFVTFFPQLIAVPIVHHSEIMPQFAEKEKRTLNFENISKGLFLFFLGLSKKVVIADTFATWANSGFNGTSALGFFDAWMTSLSYTFQLYFDFSGYTDMAVGIALLFNIVLPQNFNSPYKALNIQDFWRRWHMTLSRFLRDYIYVPLGGNKLGEWKTYRNLFLVFLIGGLWHGASWMFVIWGSLHGLAIVVHRLRQKGAIEIPRFVAWFLTFNFINITWVFFRAADMESALRVLKGMFLPFEDIFPVLFGPKTVIVLLLGSILVFFFKNSYETLQKWSPQLWHLLIVWALFFVSFYSMSGFSEFLYFNF